jgi:hypothetical protein
VHKRRKWAQLFIRYQFRISGEGMYEAEEGFCRGIAVNRVLRTGEDVAR